MTWIKLAIHPDDPRIDHLADLTGATADACWRAVLRWFFWLDRNHGDGDTSISKALFRKETKWPDDRLADAFHDPDIDWLTTGADGRLRPTRPDSHFSKSAKRRALDQSRKSETRTSPALVAPPCPTSDDMRTGSGQRADSERTREEKRREEVNTLPPTRAGAREATTAELGRRADADATKPQDGPGADPRVTALKDFGMGAGQAGGLVRRHQPSIEEVLNYVERSKAPGVESPVRLLTHLIQTKAGVEAIGADPTDAAIAAGFADAGARLAAKQGRTS